jgi:RNA polymerase sigma-70 factor (ECF subfamily)
MENGSSGRGGRAGPSRKKGGFMSERAKKNILQELASLAALDRAKAKVDTSGIPEIENWSGAETGKFYRASQMPDSQLVAECISKKSEELWREFIHRFQPVISVAVARRLGRYGNVSPELADDLVQEVYLRLCANDFKALRNFTFRQENSLDASLKVLAGNIVEDHLRKKAGGAGSLESVELGSNPEQGKTGERIESRIFIEEVNEILQKYSKEPNFERDYKIFWLYYRDGFTAHQISERLGTGLSVKGIESILHRLQKQIRSSFINQRQKASKRR